MCFNFPLMPRLFLSLLQGDKRPITTIINQTPNPPPNAQWLSFLRNHDELSLEMVTAEEGAAMYKAYAPEPRMKINNGLRRRLAPILDHDVRKYVLLNGLLMSLPGTPIIYYGDEIGMSDNIHLPDRFGVRTPMQWSDKANAGFSSAKPFLPVLEDFADWNVADQEDAPNSFLNWTRRLVKARQSQSALRNGELNFIETGDDAVLLFERVSGENRVLCLFNLSGEEKVISIDDLPSNDLLNNNWNDPILKPYTTHWLQ